MISTDLGLFAAFLIGLFGSVSHCGAMCGGFAVGVSATSPDRTLRRKRTAAYHAGRLVTYTGIGAFAGAAGSMVDLLGDQMRMLQSLAQIMGSIVLVLTGIALLLGATPLNLERRLPFWRISARASRFAGRAGWPAAFQFGLLLGFLPCGLIYGAATYAFATGDPLRGAFTLAAFGLGTVPALVGIASLAGHLRDLSAWFRVGAGSVMLLSGILFLWIGFPG